MKLRWVTKKNRVKAEEIKKHFHDHHCRWLQESKDILENWAQFSNILTRLQDIGKMFQKFWNIEIDQTFC